MTRAESVGGEEVRAETGLHEPLPLTPRDRVGPQNPAVRTPGRAPGSVRRTSTVEVLRPNGLDGELRLLGRARDLHTGRSGAVEILDEAVLDGVLSPEGLLLDVAASPEAPALRSLVGVSARAGFRSLVLGAVPELAAARSPLFTILDDVPVAALVSGYALLATGRLPARIGGSLERKIDVCSGWARGIAAETALSIGRAPQTFGPLAPELESVDDPLAWHEIGELPLGGIRRRRRLDVVPGAERGAPIAVDTMFRDSYRVLDGRETIVHEYELHAVLDPDTLVVESIDATPRVLPFGECPGAVASAQTAVGRSVVDFRAVLREELHGTSTCTHLNDLLRNLEDVAALVGRAA